MILLYNFSEIPNYIDKKIKIEGFIKSIRNLKNFVFIILRRNQKLVQCICKDMQVFNKQSLTLESSIIITGYVKLRSENNINNNQDLGKYEIYTTDIKIIKISPELPFQIQNSQINSLEIREKFRFLDLRNPDSIKLLLYRIEAIKITRKFFESLDFLEINTPIMTCVSQDGANSYIVKSRRYSDKYYALSQSPQLYKQIIMCSDIERYYQIAPCFRDEESRSNRLCTEFTQVDVEMKASNIDEVIDILLEYIIKLINGLTGSKIDIYRFDYLDMLSKYSTDQVDMRVWTKFNIRKNNNYLIFDNISNMYKDLKNTFSDIRLKDKEIIIDINSNQKNSLLMHLSNIYNNLYNSNNSHCIIFVYNYPFYETDDTGNKVFKHNPFSKTFNRYGHLYAYQYDVIMDAQEIAGGSIRETDIEKLNTYIKDNTIVNFIEMYEYGFIEHGGFALGLERFLSILFNKPIENFIPFFTLKSGTSNLIIAPNKLN